MSSSFPKAHVSTIHALPMAAQKDVWKLVSDVRAWLRTGLVPDGGFSIGFDESGGHAVVHVVPRQAGDGVELPEAGEWVVDDGVLA
jgi:diadenosine tetraphosphate (Ap4A) HIT family hydrolase